MILPDSTASGALHCGINNGGCWKKTQDGRTYSACVVSYSTLRVRLVYQFQKVRFENSNLKMQLMNM
jgi:hypothetical protein